MYKLNQKEIILDYLRLHSDYSLPASKIAHDLQKNVTRATLYRILEGLENQGIIKKIYNEQKDYYEYQYYDVNEDHSSHLHLKCLKCGKLIHLHCDISSKLVTHVSKEHNFYINQEASIIYGICASCSLIKGEVDD
jgi:Fur family ferric uptake transcriptional regulator